jgi:pimeloyl-ACP methyl ester carboxylesterase
MDPQASKRHVSQTAGLAALGCAAMLALAPVSAVCRNRVQQRLYDAAAITSRYFFPRRTAPPRATRAGQALTLETADGNRVGAYWHRPLANAPTVLYFYGNGETLSDQLRRVPRAMEQAGANVFFVDYPGYGTSSGRPTFSSCREAGRAALSYLLRQPAATMPKLIVMGRSAGSIFAIDAASRCPRGKLCGLVIESGIADVARRLEPRIDPRLPASERDRVLAQARADFDHQRALTHLACPMMTMHTEHDRIVPSSNARALSRWAGDRLFREVRFPRGDHNTIYSVNERAYLGHLRDFVASAFRRAAR